MIFNKHFDLEGTHAFLGASNYHWLNYSEEKLVKTYINLLAVKRGTELHKFAYDAIRLGIKLPKSKRSLNSYINDAIGFGMTPEVVLRYSENCFGTTDAIAFNEKKKFLRIHDFKSGVTPTHMEQLYIYHALFCLEYNYNPKDISSELRIYQNDEIVIEEPKPEDIFKIMQTIKVFDAKIAQMKKEGYI